MEVHLKGPILLLIHSAIPIVSPAAGERGQERGGFVSGASLLSANGTQRASPNVWNQTLPVGCSCSFPPAARHKLTESLLTLILSAGRDTFFVYSSPLIPLKRWYPAGLTTIYFFFLLGSEKSGLWLCGYNLCFACFVEHCGVILSGSWKSACQHNKQTPTSPKQTNKYILFQHCIISDIADDRTYNYFNAHGMWRIIISSCLTYQNRRAWISSEATQTSDH